LRRPVDALEGEAEIEELQAALSDQRDAIAELGQLSEHRRLRARFLAVQLGAIEPALAGNRRPT